MSSALNGRRKKKQLYAVEMKKCPSEPKMKTAGSLSEKKNTQSEERYVKLTIQRSN